MHWILRSSKYEPAISLMLDNNFQPQAEGFANCQINPDNKFYKNNSKNGNSY